MSSFVTSIPVDVAAVKRLLPARHFLEAVTFDPIKQSVDVVWSSPDLVTPFSTPQPFPVQALHDQALPAGVIYRVKPEAAPAGEIPPVIVKPVDKPKRRGITTR